MKIDFNIIPAICAVSDAVLLTDQRYSIKGQIKEDSISIPCRVRLHEKSSGRIVFDNVTDQNGSFEFNNLNQVLFYVIAHHPLNQFNALILDNLMPK